MSHWLNAFQLALRRLVAPAATAAVVISLAACGGGGTTPVPIAELDKRPLPVAYTTRVAVNYSPYREATGPEQLGSEDITLAEIEQDLRLVEAAGIGMIRLFSSNLFGDKVLSVIRDQGLDLKVQLGAYVVNNLKRDPDTGELERDPATGKPVVDPALEADNQAELAETIRLANRYRDIVEAVSVGNETMVYWSTLAISPQTMGGYLRQVRSRISQPVTTNDNWAFWADAPSVILDAVDFAAVHTYPLLDTFYNRSLWDWRQKSADPGERAARMTAAAIAEAKVQFGAARAYLDRAGLRDLPMVIGETGWTAVDTAGGPTLGLRAHPVNQKLYYDALQQWVAEGRAGRGPQAIFYFQAFDEQWKQGDDGWGLFNKNREARYVLGKQNCNVKWACEAGTTGYTDADAVHWVAPVPGPEVTSPTFEIYADGIAAGLRADAFGGNTADYADFAGDAAEGTNSLRVVPRPANFGWGLVFSSPGYESDPATPRTTTHLKAFEGGALTFWVKTDNYPGRIRVGISTDDNDREGQSASVVLRNGDQYGYCNTNAWCQVTIPVSAFLAANPKLELDLVFNKFTLSDIFADNGKPLNTGVSPNPALPAIHLDGIRWVR